MNQLIKGRFLRILTIMLWMTFGCISIGSSATPDSLKTRWINGKKYQMHKIVAKDTWSGISHKYEVSVKDLQQANPGVPVLKTGQIILVPVNTEVSTGKNIPDNIPASTKSTSSSIKEKEQVHIVQKGETLYRISKQYNLTVDELKKLNNLTSNNVGLGQKLKVGNVKTTSTETVVKQEKVPVAKEKPLETKPDSNKDIRKIDASKAAESGANEKSGSINPVKIEYPSVSKVDTNSRSSVTENDTKTGAEINKITETGVATWITDGELNQNKFYALHRTAPVGTIVKVTNRMNNNSVFVKVVGLLPDTGDNNNVIIKITQAAAQRIGAIDLKFTAELSYGVAK